MEVEQLKGLPSTGLALDVKVPATLTDSLHYFADALTQTGWYFCVGMCVLGISLVLFRLLKRGAQ